MGARVLLAMLIFGAAGCTGSAFACEDDQHCAGSDGLGLCELSGYCSFPDSGCPSGRRYGDAAGGGFGGLCVRDDETSGGSTSVSTSTTGAPTSTLGTDPTATVGTGSTTATTSATNSTSTTDPTSTADSVATADSGGTTDGDTCDPGLVCVPTSPSEWDGPFVAFPYDAGEPRPICPGGGAPTDLATGFAVPDTEACGCNCQAEPGRCTENATFHSDTHVCDEIDPQIGLVSSDACSSIVGFNSVRLEAGASQSGSSCGGTALPSLPAAEIESRVLLCREAMGGCGAGTGECLPPVAGTASACVARAGAHECPADYGTPYPTDGSEPGVAFEGLGDSRSCSDCDCTVETATCTGAIIYENSDCSGSTFNGGGCIDTGVSDGIRLIEPSVTCSVTTASVMMGAVSPTGLTTICCRP